MFTFGGNGFFYLSFVSYGNKPAFPQRARFVPRTEKRGEESGKRMVTQEQERGNKEVMLEGDGVTNNGHLFSCDNS